MDRPLLYGQRALVTGSTSGIGLAIARTLLEAGAEVFVHGLVDASEQDRLERELRLIGPAHFVAGDLSDASAIDGMMAQCGALDILVNNAGIQYTAALADMPSTCTAAAPSMSCTATATAPPGSARDSRLPLAAGPCGSLRACPSQSACASVSIVAAWLTLAASRVQAMKALRA